MKLSGRGKRRDKFGDQASDPINRSSNYEDITTVSHVTDAIFVPEEGSAVEEYRQGVSPPHSSSAKRRSQFILPHRRSLVSDDKSPYTKIDEFDNAY
ncbi:hypothetical protein LPJ60_006359 [Coemansia sp. RSA 2675]|nr:hypothetical protein LPJ60_006359 [Coemansia sp. RSA 2675]